MPFPFANKPFDGWVQDKLKKRRENKIDLNYLRPFIYLTSGALVTGGGKNYEGCIISNKLKVEDRYQLGKSYIGYDLAGQKIETIEDGNPGVDFGRKVSAPIIESMEIDTDGENNTVKQARLDIRIFTQKQLDMFELFFLRASMHVVLEYGNSVVNVPSPSTMVFEKEKIAPNSFLSQVDDCDQFANLFIKYHGISDAEYKASKEKYYSIIKNTEGNYDFWTATVTNFSVTFDSKSNTYKVNLELSSGNELQLWRIIKQNIRTEEDTTATNNSTVSHQNPLSYQSWINRISSDLALSDKDSISKLLEDDKKWKKEFFNWGIINKDDATQKFSKTEYISMKLILEICNKSPLWKDRPNGEIIQTNIFGTENDPIIPMNSDEFIISTNDNFILPGDLPKIEISQDKKYIIVDKRMNIPINGKDFHIHKNANAEYTIPVQTAAEPVFGEVYKTKGWIGNLLNVFVNYETFLQAYRESITYVQFYSTLLGQINKYMLGLCKLEVGSYWGDKSVTPTLTIIDKKLRQKEIKDIKPYRFKIGPIHNEVIDMSFNLEMSNLMQAQAMYATILKNAQTPSPGGTAPIPKKILINAEPSYEKQQFLDMAVVANINGLTSQDITLSKINAMPSIAKNNPDATSAKPVPKPQKTNPQTKEADNTNLNTIDVIQKNYVKFKPDQDSLPKEGSGNLIYKNPKHVIGWVKNSFEASSVLTVLECSVTIDGMVGFSCGELFHLDAVPEIYNEHGYFQITNIKQSVTQEGWRTTLEAMFRYNSPGPTSDSAKTT